jgi:periplasmic protein TonB
MDFSKRQADPRRHLTGIAFVVLFHGLLVYGLMSGLARKVVDVVRAPIETKVIEEITKPPPPPEVVVPPPPKLEAPPPPFIPPPEVQIATPPPVVPTITATTPTPPPEPTLAPIAPPVVAAAPAPAAPAVVSAAVVCSNYSTKMGEAGFPREAQRQGIDRGEALIQFTLTATGEVKDVKVVNASHPIFARNSMRIVGEYKCAGQGRDVTVKVPFGYKLE